jgi:hypothetical protein
VTYNLLRREGSAASNRWTIPLFVTLGSPLAVRRIRRALAPNEHPSCVTKWFNALDPRDTVALYPLSHQWFAIDPEVENKIDVRNETPNCHGITGYLSDPEVARRINDALVQA